MFVHVALDDADSHYGGCTTYVTYRVVKDLLRRGFSLAGLPALVRLNPYVPFKTRGNAATRFTLVVEDESRVCDVVDHVVSLVCEYSEHRGKASPGVAVLVARSLEVPEVLRWLYLKAVRDVVTLDVVSEVCGVVGVKLFGGKGRVGAAAALGASFDDATYELLVYSDPSKKRNVRLDLSYVELLDWLTHPLTFANVDLEDEKILISPAGPDPVLVGVRGDSPIHVVLFVSSLLPYIGDVVEGWLLYKTNQATELHVDHLPPRSYTYMPSRDVGLVRSVERTRVRHVRAVTNKDKLFVYRHLGKIAAVLEDSIGLVVEWWGGRKLDSDGYYTYVEGLRVLSSRLVEVRNPRCPKCGARLESCGRGRLRCRRCGYMLEKPVRELHAVKLRMRKLLSLPKLSEHRHLMKPTSRIGLEGLALEFPEPPPLWIV